ncbi:MAG: MFS transporter [Sphaerochaetaceae bacterium]|nr:MFS transporter [Sphaerochaetaceae bacterium]
MSLNKRIKINNAFKANSNILPFLISILLFGITNSVARAILNNYLAEIIQITKFQLGVIEFFRELPGLFLIVILNYILTFGEKKNYQIALIVSICGFIGLTFLGTKTWVVVIFLVMNSLGEHISMQVRQSLSIEMSNPAFSGKALGVTEGFRFIGRILGFLLVPVIFLILGHYNLGRSNAKSYQSIYFIAMLIALIAFAFAFKIPQVKTKKTQRKMYFNKKYGKYYILSFFYGARKQIFITFAPFVLVINYGASPSIMSLLFAITAGFSILFSPLIGRLIDKVGYKKVMIGDTLILIIVCFFYGFAHLLFSHEVAYRVICINYVLDSILSLCSMASLVYCKALSDNQEEVSKTITTGISFNHLISIVIALIGGWIWQKTGVEVLFSISAVLGLINSIFAATIKVDKTEKIELNNLNS